MKTTPYRKASEITNELWDNAALAVGTTRYCLREVYIRFNWLSLGGKYFCEILCNPSKGNDIIADVKEQLATLTVEEIQALKEKEENKDGSIAEERDFDDLMYYRLKQLIEIGDEIVSTKTEKYTFSNKRYLTQGKKYKIIELDDRDELLCGNFCATTETDIKKNQNTFCNYGINSVWRNGKEIWNWNLAYLELWMEQNPNHPETEKLIEHCKARAELTRKGLTEE